MTRFPEKIKDWSKLHTIIHHFKLINLLILFPNQNWNWPIVTRKMELVHVIKHPDLPWDSEVLLNKYQDLDFDKFQKKLQDCKVQMHKIKAWDGFDN